MQGLRYQDLPGRRGRVSVQIVPARVHLADRQLVTIFSAPNYCGEFDNCGAMMSVDENLMCSFQVLKPVDSSGQRWGSGRPGTPPRKPKQ